MGADPRTEIPPIGLMRFRSQRARPYLYSEDEIRRLLKAALKIESPHKLQRHTYYCLFGLLAVSGLRLSEAINLQPQDVDWPEGVLTIRGAKFGKTRLVPLHASTLAVLRKYADLRDKIFAGRILVSFLVTSHGTKLEKTNLSRIFRELSRQIGIRKPGVRHGPRLHDFRHRFAIETLLRWYRSGQEVTRRMPVLSTYLGHVNVSGTYWYLGSTPELIVAASHLIEARWKGVV
jgi:integrase